MYTSFVKPNKSVSKSHSRHAKKSANMKKRKPSSNRNQRDKLKGYNQGFPDTQFSVIH